jgi:hypothetical protein
MRLHSEMIALSTSSASKTRRKLTLHKKIHFIRGGKDSVVSSEKAIGQ